MNGAELLVHYWFVLMMHAACRPLRFGDGSVKT